ncbi:unnamed protein product, partial [Discosporangium mesarthrocarpum]
RALPETVDPLAYASLLPSTPPPSCAILSERGSGQGAGAGLDDLVPQEALFYRTKGVTGTSEAFLPRSLDEDLGEEDKDSAWPEESGDAEGPSPAGARPWATTFPAEGPGAFHTEGDDGHHYDKDTASVGARVAAAPAATTVIPVAAAAAAAERAAAATTQADYRSLSAWYQDRAREIDSQGGQLRHALELCELGLARVNAPEQPQGHEGAGPWDLHSISN